MKGTITYKTLQKKIKDGYMEVEAWSINDNWVEVREYKSNGRTERKILMVTGVPKNRMQLEFPAIQ